MGFECGNDESKLILPNYLQLVFSNILRSAAILLHLIFIQFDDTIE